MGALLPRADGARQPARRAGARTGRAGARAALALPPAAELAVPRQADLRTPLPADRGPERTCARRAAAGAPDGAPLDDVPRLPRRQRLLLRLARRGRLRLRLPAAVGRQRPRPLVLRALQRLAALPGLPRPAQPRRRLRRVRVPGT